MSKGAFTAATSGNGEALMDLPAGDVAISIDPPENSASSFTGAAEQFEPISNCSTKN